MKEIPTANQPNQIHAGVNPDKMNTSASMLTNGNVPTGTSGYGAKRVTKTEDDTLA